MMSNSSLLIIAFLLAAESLAQEASPKEGSVKPIQEQVDQNESGNFSADAEEPNDSIYDDARRSAGRQVGREIGREIARKMHQKDQESVIRKYRDALRGALLFRYSLEGGYNANRMYGYVIATREGRDRYNHYCREVEMDLIYNGQRHFERSISCLYPNDEWYPTAAAEVHFSGSGAEPQPPKIPTPGNGGWLPPIRR